MIASHFGRGVGEADGEGKTMLFIKSKYIKNLDYIVKEMQNYLSNNYKDMAHEYRVKLKDFTEEYYKNGNINDKQYRHYIAIYNKYSSLMKDYYHYRSES